MFPLKKIALAALSLIVCQLSTAASRDYSTIKKSGTIIVATEGAYPPFSLFKGKTLTGFEVDLFNAIAKELGLKVEWKTFPFDSLLIGLAQGRYDLVIASHGITDERAKAVDFSEPHYCAGGAIVAPQGGALTKDALKGKSIAVQVGTTYLKNVQKLPGVGAVKTYPKDTDCLQNLLNKRVDNWVTDKFVALEALKQHTHLRLGEMLFVEKIAMAVAKGNSTLVKELNSGLAKVLSNGVYKKISETYFGQDIRCQ